MQILIIGDSFAADWSVRDNSYPGWPNLLAQNYKVTNLAQAGVSEYKILKQILSVNDLSIYNVIVVAHTSPYRVHTRNHPVHAKDQLHKSADLIYADIEYHSNTFYGWVNRSLQAAMQYYRWHFDDEYYESIYCLIREKINSIIGNIPCITIQNFPTTFPYTLDAQSIRNEHPGTINHMSEIGNQLVYDAIVKKINEITD